MSIVIIENRGIGKDKAVGPYKSYDLAQVDSRALGGRVLILEERIKAATDGAVLRARNARQ